MKRKSGSGRLFAIVFGLPLALVAPLALLGAGLHHSGVLHVEVCDKGERGTSLGVTLPAAVVPVAMHLVPAHVMRDVRDDMDDDARTALNLACAALESIRRGPDGVYVDIHTRDEIVRVEKRGGALHVLVDTPDEIVRASVPFAVAGSVLRAI
jgi:hypothetical protein